MMKIPEVSFGEGGPDDRTTVRTAKLHRSHLPSDALTNGGTLILVRVNSPAIRTVKKGDLAFVDVDDTTLSPEGQFCFWDGLAVGFASMHMIQPDGVRQIVIQRLGMESQTVTPDAVPIIGRVVGGIVR